MVDQGPAGAAADLASAGIDLWRGDLLGAFLGLLAALPILGVGAGAAKKGRKVAMAADKARDAQKAAEAATETKKCVAPKGKLEQHHSDPKFMGGDPKQPTTGMPKDTHRGASESLHNDLNDFLRGQTDAAGNHMRPQRRNSGAKIRDNFTREERLNALAEFYKTFRKKYPDAARDFFNQHPHLK
jgi:hypothetical protein